MLESNNETPLSCPMCDSGVSPNEEFCPSCSWPMSLTAAMEEDQKEKIPDAKADVKELAQKKSTPRKKKVPVDELTLDKLKKAIDEARARGTKIAIGIDPGARYTGVCIVDEKDTIHFLTTLYREDDEEQVEWAYRNVDWISQITDVMEFDVIAIENTTDPLGFDNGKKQPLNPKHIIRTAIVVGVLAMKYRDKNCVMIRPRKNGNKGPYQAVLNGTRSKALSWHIDKRVSVRDHERSAYDVAKTGFFEIRKS